MRQFYQVLFGCKNARKEISALFSVQYNMEVKNVITRCSSKIAGFAPKLFVSLSFVPPLAVAEMCQCFKRGSRAKKKEFVIFFGRERRQSSRNARIFCKKVHFKPLKLDA